MKKVRVNLIMTGLLFLAFTVVTVLVMKYDVMPIGPEGSLVGCATLNKFVFEILGENLIWYHITDWLGVVAIVVALCFGILGLSQWIRRRRLLKVDGDILSLGVFYLLVIAIYMFFELYIVNYRPIMIAENLEASFPSSHTLIVLCILGTAMMQFHKRISNSIVRGALEWSASGVITVTLVGRLISGVHWFTDIVAGLLLGAALVMLYYTVLQWIKNKPKSDVDK